MKQYNFASLDDLFKCFDRSEVVPIDTLKQAMFYIRLGIQPELVWPKEDEPGRMTFWFLKKKTQYVYNEWKKTKDEGKITLKKISE